MNLVEKEVSESRALGDSEIEEEKRRGIWKDMYMRESANKMEEIERN